VVKISYLDKEFKGRDEKLADTATKSVLLPRNVCLSGRLEEMCRTRWALHWKSVSLYCLFL